MAAVIHRALVHQPIAVIIDLVTDFFWERTTGSTGVAHSLIGLAIAVIVFAIAHLDGCWAAGAAGVAILGMLIIGAVAVVIETIAQLSHRALPVSTTRQLPLLQQNAGLTLKTARAALAHAKCLRRSTIAMKRWPFFTAAGFFDPTIAVFIERDTRFTRATYFRRIGDPTPAWTPYAFVYIAIDIVVDFVADLSYAHRCSLFTAFINPTITIAVDVVAAGILTRQYIADTGLDPAFVITVHKATTTHPNAQGCGQSAIARLLESTIAVAGLIDIAIAIIIEAIAIVAPRAVTALFWYRSTGSAEVGQALIYQPITVFIGAFALLFTR